MNIVLFSDEKKEYCIACIKVGIGDSGIPNYMVQGKRIDSFGRFIAFGQPFNFSVKKEAEKRCISLARIKRRHGYKEIALDVVQSYLHKHLEVPPDMKLTPQQMIEFLTKSRRERYVVFKDISGLEDCFDLGVQYLAYTVDEDDVLLVYDKFGEARNCFKERFLTIVLTEVNEKGNKNG